MRLVVVDDEKILLEQLLSCLRQAAPQAEILAFQSEAELLEQVDAAEIDGAFLDIKMSGMGGVALAKRLRCRNPALPLVFATGYSAQASRAVSLGTGGYLLKPVTVEQVAQELERMKHPQLLPVEGLDIRCFGRFAVRCNGKEIPLPERSRELLAYLVHRCGAVVSASEAFAALYGRRMGVGDALRLVVIRSRLNGALASAGVAQALDPGRGWTWVQPRYFHCDFYDYLSGDPEGVRAFHGEYLPEYPWARPMQEALLRGEEPTLNT